MELIRGSLDQLGILDEVKSASGQPRYMKRISQDGEDLGKLNIEKINRWMGYSSFSILRRDFHRILCDKLGSLNIPIQYQHSAISIDQTQQEALVKFANGRQIQADLIIGADGRMASLTRQFILNTNKPEFQGFINWIGVYESKTDRLTDLDIQDYWGVGKRFGIVPVNQHKAYWAGGIACDKVGIRKPDLYKKELLTHFSSWPDPIYMVIKNTPLTHINKIYVHDHNPNQIWHKNKVIMIGDAAHAPLPTSGQGACQALEDALLLAENLHRNPENPELVFSEFTSVRYQKTSNITFAARDFAASLFNRDIQFCRSRNERSINTDFDQMATAISSTWSKNLPLGADHESMGNRSKF